MKFMNEFIIYRSDKTIVYANQCHNPKHKTKLFAIRKDDKSGIAHFLGLIKFNGSWRQYVFYPDDKTYWSASCLRAISVFCREQTVRWREKK